MVIVEVYDRPVSQIVTIHGKLFGQWKNKNKFATLEDYFLHKFATLENKRQIKFATYSCNKFGQKFLLNFLKTIFFREKQIQTYSQDH